MLYKADNLDTRGVEAFCGRWKVKELALFGSALGANFRANSDIDLLVTFVPGVQWSLLDHAAMELELRQMMGRDVALVTRNAVERSGNWLRRESILNSARVLYAA